MNMRAYEETILYVYQGWVRVPHLMKKLMLTNI